jgi:1,2-diacylglycerol 3-beta-galactosyltransferase
MPRIELVYFNAGGGHRAAARALEAAVKHRRPSWELGQVNLFDVLDPHRHFRRLAEIEAEDYYNLRLKKGWTAGLAQELKILQAGIRLAHAFLVGRLMHHWATSAPDLVVSLIPNFNRTLVEGICAVRPGVPYLTVMTDLADYPPSFWIEPGAAQHVVCGTGRAVDQARAMGVAEERIHRVSGMVLHPDFYGPQLVELSAEKESLGLDPKQPAGIVMFGGHGAPATETIARELDDVQLVLLCGHNAKLAARMRGIKAEAPRAVLG